MFGIGIAEVLIVLVIVLLILGPGRIAKTMSELGKGIRTFRESLISEEKTGSVSDENIDPK